jgi:hypothetical protein
MIGFELKGETLRVNTKDARYSVTENASGLPPVTLVVFAGVMSFQDYLTPDQADELAAALTEVARAAREVSS